MGGKDLVQGLNPCFPERWCGWHLASPVDSRVRSGKAIEFQIVNSVI
jgi:hypothetical protein